MNNQASLSRKTWLAIVILGLVGQLAWMVENFYFNTFLFKEMGGTAVDIRNMVALSGIVATITTILMGAWSDKLKNRRLFIAVGYIIWGLITLSFAFISKTSLETLFPSMPLAQLMSFGVALVIVMDCVMTFFGSTANDAAFNAWITETTNEHNRAGVEGVLGAFPLLAMLIITGLGAVAIDLLGYGLFFAIIGLLVVACGIVSLFLVKDEDKKSHEDISYWKRVIYGFKASTIKTYPQLYLTMLAQCLFSISFQVFMTYILIYFEHNLGLTMIEYGLMLAVMILVASIIGIVFGRIMDKKGKKRFALVSYLLYVVSLFVLALVSNYYLLMLMGTILLAGDILLVTVLGSTIRDETPKGKAGLFQGIRLVFVVLIPMLIGPTLGELAIRSSQVTFINEFNETVLVPNAGIFVMAGIVGLFVIVPLWFVLKTLNNKQRVDH
ncbi:MAG: MFS transporter [Bacilli bacterium]